MISEKEHEIVKILLSCESLEEFYRVAERTKHAIRIIRDHKERVWELENDFEKVMRVDKKREMKE